MLQKSFMTRVFSTSPAIRVLPDKVQLTGINGRFLADVMAKTYKTTRISNHLLTSASRFKMEFPLFYALEVYLILDRISKGPTKSKVPRRTIKTVQELIYNETWVKYAIDDTKDEVTLPKLPMAFQPLEKQADFLKTYISRKHKWGLHGMMLAAVCH